MCFSKVGLGLALVDCKINLRIGTRLDLKGRQGKKDQKIKYIFLGKDKTQLDDL
jgi:hypothetical protein